MSGKAEFKDPKDIKYEKTFREKSLGKQLKDINPLQQTIKTEDGLTIKYKVDPKVNFAKILTDQKVEVKKIKFNLEVNKELEDSDVELNFKVNGDLLTLSSPKGQQEFTASFKATTKF